MIIVATFYHSPSSPLCLINRAEKFTKDGRHIWMAGVDDPYIHRDRLDAALQGVDDGSPIILLSHAPNIFPEATEKNIDLVLAGHTHGGQVRIPFIGAVKVPGQGLFPKWDYGLFKSKNTTMLINGGLGESGILVRFNNKPEIVLVTLQPFPSHGAETTDTGGQSRR